MTAALAERLPGPDILDALLAVRRYEQVHYAQQDAASLADRFRFAWSPRPDSTGGQPTTDGSAVAKEAR